MQVLIVEDNPISATVLEHTLDKHGYETLTAHDGEQALTILESHPEIELVITDLVMPKTDGVELVAKIRERSEWNAIPIFVCTSTRPEKAQHQLNGRVAKYLIKPIMANSLIQKVNEAFAQKRQILQDPKLTMAQIGIGSDAFAEVVDKFADSVNDAVNLVERQRDDTAREPLDLKNLLEGATLLRAERLIDIVTTLERSPRSRQPETMRSTIPSLLRELKAMQYHLKLYTS